MQCSSYVAFILSLLYLFQVHKISTGFLNCVHAALFLHAFS